MVLINNIQINLENKNFFKKWMNIFRINYECRSFLPMYKLGFIIVLVHVVIIILTINCSIIKQLFKKKGKPFVNTTSWDRCHLSPPSCHYRIHSISAILYVYNVYMHMHINLHIYPIVVANACNMCSWETNKWRERKTEKSKNSPTTGSGL